MYKLKKLNINKKLLISILLFMLISVLTINSSMLYLPSYLGNLALKQAMWYLLGFLIIFLILILPNTNHNYIYYLYIFNLFLLALLLLFGESINGSKCWFIIPGIGSMQPSEFMKIILILITSLVVYYWTNKLPNKVKFKDEIKLFFLILLIYIPPTILTFLEPDTGAILIYSIIVFSILWTSPLRKRWFIIILFIILLLLSSFLGLYFFKQDLFVQIFGTDLFYRIDRLLDWKNGTGMQLENSLAAIGSSGLIGHGYKKTPIYFPEAGTDFIFSVYASNFGFIGCILFFILLIFFDKSIIEIGKNSTNIYDKYIISGTIGMLLYQQIQNIGMTLGILPITGITLPFISYGGSSLLSYLLIIGIIFKIYNNSKRAINR